MLRVVLLLALFTGCSSESKPATHEPAGTLNDPVEVCKRFGDVCRLDGSRLGVCNQAQGAAVTGACGGRTPCLSCMPQH